MSLNAKEVGQGIIQPALGAGTYPGRTCLLVDLGEQKQEYQGEVKKPARELYLGYELADEFMVDENGNVLEDKPRWFGERFPLRNLLADNAKSTKRYVALDPDDDFDGDFTKLLDIPCLITITNEPHSAGKHKGKVFNNVSNVSCMRAKERGSAPALKGDTRLSLFDKPDMKALNSVPPWMKDKVLDALDYEGSAMKVLMEGSDTLAEDSGEEW